VSVQSAKVYREEHASPNAFVAKLLSRAGLAPDEIEILGDAGATARQYPAKCDLIREGDEPGPVFVFLEGWGCRYKIMPEGGRQILAFMAPGDFSDPHTNVLDEMDHTVATVTSALVATIPRARVEELIELSPAITRAFWLMQLVDLGVARSWIASIGRRGSIERVTHLMCELYFRAHASGLISNGECRMPHSQILIADALGLTPVHVNRVLRKLKEADLMRLDNGALVIDDIAQLSCIAGFDDTYLQRRLGPDDGKAENAGRRTDVVA